MVTWIYVITHDCIAHLTYKYTPAEALPLIERIRYFALKKLLIYNMFQLLSQGLNIYRSMVIPT